MRRFVPKSLLGQMLLAVALALLVAQTISAVLLYRAEENRIESGLANELAFQLITDRQANGRAADRREARPDGVRQRGQRRPGLRRVRVERAVTSPLAQGESRDPAREETLRNVLQRQGVVIGELVVLSRQISQDPFVLQRLRRNPRFLERRGWSSEGELVVAGLKRQGADTWVIARSPRPQPARRTMIGIIIQTLILYLVLVGGLAFLLRRLTRPLAQLTKRVEGFGGTLGTEPPLEPSGPQDARRLITAHNAMEGRIAALLDEKNVMLGAIGHDLKTPLAALRVRIESVENETERARMAATIEDITSSLDDILSLARVGRPTDPLERTELSALVASVFEEFEDMGENVVLGETQRMASPLRATWMRRALRNLISNALRYGKQARIALAREGDTAVIRIADSGPGISDDQIAAMMEPFARGDTSRNRSTGGAGLGLTLARAIAEQHGGKLLLTNRIGADGGVVGLLAEIRLPLA
ncbi:histidine kinase [Aurantiacibacter marinus]|uniref:histidine kinase n=2 Tax=Aurantiacibacter marinus TaxID=874156 RepID=A0A0H0XS62_9SPHN|nr:ATP-binding protein [Aurantiacibacter marinus]KLI65199.1 histidine kinase [Aurantiacibacter marinus]